MLAIIVTIRNEKDKYYFHFANQKRRMLKIAFASEEDKEERRETTFGLVSFKGQSAPWLLQRKAESKRREKR